MFNKLLRINLTSVFTWEMKDRTIMYHFTPIRLTEVKKSDVNKSWGGCRVVGGKK